jgi:hypothetical protein
VGGRRNAGDPHYYRIQTSALLIEYDNTQNNNNHITVCGATSRATSGSTAGRALQN